MTAGFSKERQKLQTRIAAGEKANKFLEVLCVCVVTTCIYVYQSMPSLNAFSAGLYLIICMYVYIYIYLYFRRAVILCSQTPPAVCLRWARNSALLQGDARGVSWRVDRRQFVAPKKSATQIPTRTKIDTLFFVHLRMMNARFRKRCCVYMCKKSAQCLRKDACALWHTNVPWLLLQNEGATKKMPSRETVG